MNFNWNTVSVVSHPRSIFSTPLISPNVSMPRARFFGDVDDELGCCGAAAHTPSWSAEIWRGIICVSHRRTWTFPIIGSTEQIKYLYGTTWSAGMETTRDHTFESVTSEENCFDYKLFLISCCYFFFFVRRILKGEQSVNMTQSNALPPIYL